MQGLARAHHCDSMQADMAHEQLQADNLFELKQKIALHPQWADVQEISQMLSKNGYQCCLVGGSVRDFLLGLTPADLDLVTDATPEKIKLLFKKTLDLGVRFGVSQIVLNNSVIDLATFRSEDLYFDGRHPEQILFSTMGEDFKRRDFTINSLYIDLQTWEIHDFCHALSDIKSKTLRTIGDAKKRFLEDHLRLLRAVRFAAKLNLVIEPETQQAIRASSSLLSKISSPRLTEELKKGFHLEHRQRYLQLLSDLELWGIIFPQIQFHLLEIEHPQMQKLLTNCSWPSFLSALYLAFAPDKEKPQTRDAKRRHIEGFFSPLLLLRQEKKLMTTAVSNLIETQRQDHLIFREFLAKTQL